MTSGWSLSRKIAGLALLNAMLAGLAVYLFASAHYGLGPESLLVGPARERILAIGNSFRLDVAGQADPMQLMAAYSQRYEAEVFLTEPDGRPIYGTPVEVPEAVRDTMRRDGGPIPKGPGKGPLKGPRKGPPKDGPREPFFFTVTRNPVRYWAGVRIPVPDPEGQPVPAILLFRSASLFNTKLFFDWRPWVTLAAAVASISAACWLPFLRSLTRAIAQMDRVTEEIAEGRFSGRVSDRRSDELGHLGAQINRMAARLEEFVRSQKRFLGDTAHELSAPIARIQFALGILEQRVDEARQADIEVLRAEIEEMSALVGELLSFSKAGMQPEALALESVQVAEVARRAAAREGVDARIQIDEGLRARALEGPLMRALGNLLRNASRYAGDGGPITIVARKELDRVLITVADEGPGLPAEALEHVFEPFYRPQSSRSRDTGGVGLGLAIVKTCVEACQGQVTCRNRSPRGLEVTIVLGA